MALDRQMKSIREAVDEIAQLQASDAFLISAESGASISFEALKTHSVALCGMLRRHGLKGGGKVAFLMDNGIFTAQLFLGCMYGGYVVVPLNARAGAMQLSYMLDHCDAELIFVEEQYRSLLSDALSDIHRDIRIVAANGDEPFSEFEPGIDGEPLTVPAPEDVALLMYSSGSTGKPKAAIHTHSSILAHGRNSIEAHRLSKIDRSLLVLPLYHINAECVTLVPTLLSGGSVVIAHRFDVTRFWDWIDSLQITWSALVPTIISELVEWNDPGKDRHPDAISRIRFFRSSSAPLSPSLHRQFLAKFDIPLIQAMGSTECGNVFSNPVPPGENKIGSPGMPWGFEARIVDRQGNDVPLGEAGEVLLRGPGLMRGYYKDPDGTTAVVDSHGWLHTGDLARQDGDGYFFIVGRSKELIIKGGVNIAPRQIDEVLESHPAVLEAAAVGIPDRYFGEDAVAFVVLRPDSTADEKELLAFCETRLGHFKTPSRIHFLRELPKGPSGKVQRLKLLEPDILSSIAVTRVPASETTASNNNLNETRVDSSSVHESIDQIVSEAWAQILGVPLVDPQANFFALGGHSLLAIQCLSKLREKLPIVLSLADFFENGTVAEQVKLIRQRLQTINTQNEDAALGSSTNWEQSLLQQYVAPAEKPIPHRSDPLLPYPFGPAEQRLWFMEQLNPGLRVYNEAEAVQLRGRLNVDAFESALNAVVARHDVLRATVKVVESTPHWVVHESWLIPIKKIDLCSLSPIERQTEIDRLLIEEPRVLYDLEAEPGIRFTLICVGPSEHVFILMLHHLVGDWSSEGVFWRELSALYHTFLSDEAAILPAVSVTHGDYTAWQQQKLATESFDEDLAYWEEALSGAPALLELPADRPRPPRMSYGGGRLRWKIDRTVTEALRDLSRREKTSLFTIFAAALDVLFYRYTGTDDISLGIPLADRDQRELQSMIGFLLHTHVLRTRLSKGMSFRELLGRVQKGTLDLYAHRSVPFDWVVRKVHPERNLSYSPLFQVMLNWRERDQLLSFIGMDGLAIDSLMASARTSKFDMLLFATDNGDEIWLELEYSTDLFDEDRMYRMLSHYQTLLVSVINDPSQSIDHLSILPAEEHNQLVHGWNDTQAEFPSGKCVHQLFEMQAQKTPNAVAISFEAKELTYAELNRRANQLAHHLRELGVVPDARVAICVERSLEMVIAILGVLKAGGAYVPLDPAYPTDRLQFMLRDSHPTALITQSHLVSKFGQLDKRLCVLHIDLPHCAWEGHPELDLTPDSVGLTPENLAYIVYTSGSTGQPKGVMGLHRATVNRFWWMYKKYPFESNEVCCARASLSFVDAVWELLGPLCAGVRLVVISADQSYDLSAFSRTLTDNHISRLLVVPALLQAFTQAQRSGEITLPTLKYCFTSGEALANSLASEFVRLFPNTILVNLYGSSEDAGDVTCYEVKSEVHQGLIPIGRPIFNAKVYILDSDQQPVPIGVPGELFVGGLGIARGYFNRADLTEARFISDPFTIERPARMFKTGDVGRWLNDGNIEYLGRNDDQVKIRGFRIELKEIEHNLASHPSVKEAAVVTWQDQDGDKHLVAYYVLHPGQHAGSADLREHLRERLPEYMCPSFFTALSSLPLTPNRKIDRDAFPPPSISAIDSSSISTGAQSIAESQLLKIWQETLKRTITLDDNFFDIGGHSLLAARMFVLIEKRLGIRLPLATLFQNPTVRTLASKIDKTAQLSDWNSLVPMRISGSRPPLFLVHGAEGNVLLYRNIAEYLGDDQPVYGLQSQGLDGTELTGVTIESIARQYIKEIRSVQSSGPYYLGGYCLGGTIAFEIAQQLRQAGESIALVALLETYNLKSRPPVSIALKLLRKVQNIYFQSGNLMLSRGSSRFFAEKVRVELSRFKVQCEILRSRVFAKFGSNGRTKYTHIQIKEVNHRAQEAYNPRPYDGRVLVCRSKAYYLGFKDAQYGWGDIATQGVQVIELSHFPHGSLNRPFVRTLAHVLRDEIDKTLDDAEGLSGSTVTVDEGIALEV